MKNNILFLLHLPPPVHGSSVVGLSIKESEHINQTFEGRYINLLASKKVDESGNVNIRKLFGFVGIGLKLFGELMKQKPTLCYFALTTTGAAFYRDVLLVILLKLFCVKRVYHLHNKGVSRCAQHRTNRLFYKFVFKGTNVILLSKNLYSDIQEFVNESEVYICPNGITDQLPKSKNQSKNKLESVVRILFLSNLIESKGVFILLEAFAFLKKNGMHFEGVFIGGESDVTITKFNNWVNQLELNQQVVYLGRKYGREKHQAFSEADIFTFPTYYNNECFPLVLLEAMQFSLPVISTFEGGIPDIVEDGVTGFLVPQKNSKVLAERLEFLMKKPELRTKMGMAGRSKYEKEFTLENFDTNLVSILKQIIENK